MESVLRPVYISLTFLVANVLILLTILYFSRRKDPNPEKGPSLRAQGARDESTAAGRVLSASDILGWEFAYAQTTASEAMQDRHTMINYYLLAVGVVITGVISVLEMGDRLPEGTATILLWLLCGVGWLYFLKIIRLRQAWHDSAMAMSQIKDFYIQHSKDFKGEVLRNAFRWKTRTLPKPGKLWNVYFYSALLIAFLNSVIYVAGSILLNLDLALSYFTVWALLILFGLLFFAFHIWMYSASFR